MAWPGTRTKAQNAFIVAAYKTTGSMTEALKTLDSGDPVAVKKLAGKWGIAIDDKTSAAWIKTFSDNQGEPLPQPGDSKMVC